MMKYYIIYSDFDGQYVFVMESEAQCLEQLALVNQFFKAKENGTTEPIVLYGVKKDFEAIEVATVFKFK